MSKSNGYADIVDAHGRHRQVKCPIDASTGDFVLIGMGFAIEKISEEKYSELAEAQREAANACG